MKRFFLVGILVFSWVFVFAIDPPQLRCLAVDAAGSVTLTWIPPTNTSGFTRYEIFYSTNGTTFSSVGQVTSATSTTFTHTGADALNFAQCFYYVNACSNTSTAPSDTLCTIELYLTNGNGTAILNWAAPISPMLPSYAQNYDVWKEYPSTVWNNIASPNALIYRDVIDVCEATIGYRVELEDASGCRNVSRRLEDIFTDRTAPDIPQLDSVSVDFNTSRIRLGWERSLNPDVNAYIIYHFENGLWIPIDTANGIDNTSWEDFENASTSVQQYRIAALDSCMNSSPLSNPQHNFSVQATYDLCRREAVLTWDEYENLPPDIEGYRIFFATNGGPLQFAGEVAANVRTFTLQQLIPQSTYDCVIRAFNLGGNITASSKKCTFLFNSAENHDFVYIRYVSVVNNNAIEIKVSTGTTVSYTKVHLYRSSNPDSNFVQIAELTNNGTDTYVFEDADVKVDRFTYYYRATVENDCDVETMTSNTAHNILLKGQSVRDARESDLVWTLYGDWAGGVSHYQLFRKTQIDSYFSSIGGNLSATTYQDDVTELRRAGECFSYYIEAVENMDEYGFMETSRSNTVELKQLPVTYVPNAFCPTTLGANRVFLPINSFVTMENYHLYIYSRDGMLLFHSTSPEIGWNGGYNGTLMPAGCYVYKIFYTYGDEGEYELTGTVTLVR